jgi:hypothetical protein
MRSGSDYVSSMPHRLDRLLVLAAVLLLGVATWTSLRSSPAPRPAPKAVLPPAPVPEDVREVPSSTAFLRHCPASSLHLSVEPGGRLRLRFAGGRCHVPPLRLQAVERDAAGRVVYRGPALASEALSGNYAGAGTAVGQLLGPCGNGSLAVVVSGSGLSARGRC